MCIAFKIAFANLWHLCLPISIKKLEHICDENSLHDWMQNDSHKLNGWA